MKSMLLPAILMAAVAFAATANAGVLVMPPPGAARIANADVVLVGKVTSIEPQDVVVGTAKYRIAVVQIDDAIKGTKEGVKSVRIGFNPIEKPKPNVFVTGGRPVQLQVGQGGLFLLKKNDKESFFEIGGIAGYYVNSDKNDDFGEVAAAKTAARASANPQTSLKHGRDERFAAAAILVEKYALPWPESSSGSDRRRGKQAHHEGAWRCRLEDAGQLHVAAAERGQLFQRLSVTKADGFMPPAGANFQEAAQAWLRDNAEKYRIQRYVDGK